MIPFPVLSDLLLYVSGNERFCGCGIQKSGISKSNFRDSLIAGSQDLWHKKGTFMKVNTGYV